MADPFILTTQLRVTGPIGLDGVCNTIRSRISNAIRQGATQGTSGLSHIFGGVGGGGGSGGSSGGGSNTSSVTAVANATNQATNATKKFRIEATNLGRQFEMNRRLMSTTIRDVATLTGGIITLHGAFIALGRGIKFFSDYEAGLGEMAQVTRSSIGTVKSLGNEIRTLSMHYGVANEALSQNAIELLQAGRNLQQVRQVLPTLALLGTNSQVGAKGLQDATKAMITWQNVFGMGQKQLNQAFEKSIKLAKDEYITVQELIDASTVLASTAKASGASFEEMIAVMAAAKSQSGRPATEIARALNTMWSNMVAPENLAKLQKMNIQVFDTKGKFRGPMAIMEDIKRLRDTVGETSKAGMDLDLILGGIRRRSLAGAALDSLDQAKKDLLGIRGEVHEMDEDWKRIENTFGVKMQKTLASIQNAFIRLMEETPFGSLSKQVLDFTGYLAGAVTQLGAVIPLLAAIGAYKFGGMLFGGGGAAIGKMGAPAVTGAGSGMRNYQAAMNVTAMTNTPGYQAPSIFSQWLNGTPLQQQQQLVYNKKIDRVINGGIRRLERQRRAELSQFKPIGQIPIYKPVYKYDPSNNNYIQTGHRIVGMQDEYSGYDLDQMASINKQYDRRASLLRLKGRLQKNFPGLGRLGRAAVSPGATMIYAMGAQALAQQNPENSLIQGLAGGTTGLAMGKMLGLSGSATVFIAALSAASAALNTWHDNLLKNISKQSEATLKNMQTAEEVFNLNGNLNSYSTQMGSAAATDIANLEKIQSGEYSGKADQIKRVGKALTSGDFDSLTDWSKGTPIGPFAGLGWLFGDKNNKDGRTIAQDMQTEQEAQWLAANGKGTEKFEQRMKYSKDVISRRSKELGGDRKAFDTAYMEFMNDPKNVQIRKAMGNAGSELLFAWSESVRNNQKKMDELSDALANSVDALNRSNWSQQAAALTWELSNSQALKYNVAGTVNSETPIARNLGGLSSWLHPMFNTDLANINPGILPDDLRTSALNLSQTAQNWRGVLHGGVNFANANQARQAIVTAAAPALQGDVNKALENFDFSQLSTGTDEQRIAKLFEALESVGISAEDTRKILNQLGDATTDWNKRLDELRVTITQGIGKAWESRGAAIEGGHRASFAYLDLAERRASFSGRPLGMGAGDRLVRRYATDMAGSDDPNQLLANIQNARARMTQDMNPREWTMLENQINSNVKALEALANTTDRLRGSQEDLDRIQKSMSGKYSAVEDWITADPQARRQMMQDAMAAQSAMTRGSFNGMSPQAAEAALRHLNRMRDIEGVDVNGRTGEQVRRQLLMNSAPGFFAPELGAKRDVEANISTIMKSAADAQFALAQQELNNFQWLVQQIADQNNKFLNGLANIQGVPGIAPAPGVAPAAGIAPAPMPLPQGVQPPGAPQGNMGVGAAGLQGRINPAGNNPAVQLPIAQQPNAAGMNWQNPQAFLPAAPVLPNALPPNGIGNPWLNRRPTDPEEAMPQRIQGQRLRHDGSVITTYAELRQRADNRYEADNLERHLNFSYRKYRGRMIQRSGGDITEDKIRRDFETNEAPNELQLLRQLRMRQNGIVMPPEQRQGAPGQPPAPQNVVPQAFAQAAQGFQQSATAMQQSATDIVNAANVMQEAAKKMQDAFANAQVQVAMSQDLNVNLNGEAASGMTEDAVRVIADQAAKAMAADIQRRLGTPIA